MNVLGLTRADFELLKARYGEHGNSHRRMTAALTEAGVSPVCERMSLLRKMEIQFGVDLGSLCYRFAHRNDPGTHLIEQTVLAYVAQWRGSDAGGEEFWVLLDRVRQVRELTEEGQLAREPEH